MTALAPQALAIALGVLVLAEGAYLFLRKRFPAFRPRLTYHLWALALATLAALAFAGLDLEARLGTKLLMAAVLVLSAVVLYALVEALVLLRPWNAELGPSMPSCASWCRGTGWRPPPTRRPSKRTARPPVAN